MTTPIGTRRDWARMSTADRNAVIAGLQRAKSSDAYDRLTELHQQAMLGNANEWHRRPILLPAHRWFLLQLEAAMGVPMPYWNWTVNRGLPGGLGGNGDSSQGYRVTRGPFANWSSRIYNTSTGTFTSRPGIIRQMATFAASLPTATQLTQVLNQSTYDSSPWNASAAGFRNMLEGGTGFPKPAMHNRVHEWVGGDMRAGTSPNDPVFWFHHSNVDRIWASWQRRWGTDRYQAPLAQGPDRPMPLCNGTTPRQMFPIPPYDVYL
jgi:tyrosinase